MQVGFQKSTAQFHFWSVRRYNAAPSNGWNDFVRDIRRLPEGGQLGIEAAGEYFNRAR